MNSLGRSRGLGRNAGLRSGVNAGAVFLAVLLAGGCDGPMGGVLVDLKSDLAPGSDVHAVAVFLNAEGAPTATEPVAVRALFSGDDLLSGLRVAESFDLPEGTYRIRVALLDEAGNTFTERPILVEVSGTIGVTALVTRDCVGVTCSDETSACYGGACTDPRCTPETPETCTTECASAGECPALADCSAARCEDGLCLYDAMDTACSPTERCDVDNGCVPRSDCADGLLCDRVCIDPRTDAANCGGCGIACPAPTAGGSAGCADARCAVTCDAGLVECGTECLASCETAYDAAGTVTYTVPLGCTEVLVKAWGAGGGGSCGAATPGAGGYAQAVIGVSGGEMLTVIVGGAGGTGNTGVVGVGGDPGGGGAGGNAGCGGGGGGGFSGVFRGAVDQASALVVAAGGGGSGSRPPGGSPAGAGGGAVGQDGQVTGSGGTQTMGGVGSMNGGRVGQPGVALRGGDSDTVRSGNDGGGGGGGGWFGGGAANNASTNAGGGGGGSSYATGSAIVLVGGNRLVPGNDADAARGMAGAPGQPGRVSLACVR